MYRRLFGGLLKLNFFLLTSWREIDDMLLSIAIFFLHLFSSAYNSFSATLVMANAFVFYFESLSFSIHVVSAVTNFSLVESNSLRIRFISKRS